MNTCDQNVSKQEKINKTNYKVFKSPSFFNEKK